MPWQRARHRKSLLAHFVMNTETKREIPYVCRSSNIAIASHCPSNSLASPCICLVQHGVPWHKNFQIQLTKSSPLSNFQKVFLRDHLSALWNLQVKNLSISGAKSIFGVFKELWRTLFSCQRWKVVMIWDCNVGRFYWKFLFWNQQLICLSCETFKRKICALNFWCKTKNFDFDFFLHVVHCSYEPLPMKAEF